MDDDEYFWDSDDDSELGTPGPINCEVAKGVLVNWATFLTGRPSNELWEPFSAWVNEAVKAGELRISVPAPPPPPPADYPQKERGYEGKCVLPCHRQHRGDDGRYCKRHLYIMWGRSYMFVPDPTHKACQVHVVEEQW